MSRSGCWLNKSRQTVHFQIIPEQLETELNIQTHFHMEVKLNWE